MRKIKFRVWDNLHKLMLYEFSGWDDCVDILSEVWKYFIGGDYIIMQYTGIKDINNIEVYEGDIVRVRCMRKYKKLFYHDIVVFEDNCWKVKNNKTYLSDNFSLVGCEKVGNIYENSELLENIA